MTCRRRPVTRDLLDISQVQLSRSWDQAEERDLVLLPDLGIGKKDTRERFLPWSPQGSVTASMSCEQGSPRGFQHRELEQGAVRGGRCGGQGVTSTGQGWVKEKVEPERRCHQGAGSRTGRSVSSTALPQYSKEN